MDQKQASIEKENESRRQFEVAKGAKEDELKKSKDEKASKENTLEECKAKIEHFTSVIAQAEVDIKDAKEYVAKLLSDRALFSKEYDGRVTMRNSEQAATQAALDALQEVTAGAKSGVEGAFLQTVHKMSHRVPCPHCAAAVQKLFKVASDTKNAALVQLGSAIESNLKGTSKQPQAYFDASARDPVKNLLHEMIVKLEDELGGDVAPRVVRDREGHVRGGEARARDEHREPHGGDRGVEHGDRSAHGGDRVPALGAHPHPARDGRGDPAAQGGARDVPEGEDRPRRGDCGPG
jgi:hypothetical protein